MPTISERRVVREDLEKMGFKPVFQAPPISSPGFQPDSRFSVNGNPAPQRSVPPEEFAYDFHLKQFSPDGPFSYRGFVNSNQFTYDLVLRALTTNKLPSVQ